MTKPKPKTTPEYPAKKKGKQPRNSYIRDDGVEMVEIAPEVYVSAEYAKAVGK